MTKSEPEGLDRHEMVKKPLKRVGRTLEVSRKGVSMSLNVVVCVVTRKIPDRRGVIQATPEDFSAGIRGCVGADETKQHPRPLDRRLTTQDVATRIHFRRGALWLRPSEIYG